MRFGSLSKIVLVLFLGGCTPVHNLSTTPTKTVLPKTDSVQPGRFIPSVGTSSHYSSVATKHGPVDFSLPKVEGIVPDGRLKMVAKSILELHSAGHKNLAIGQQLLWWHGVATVTVQQETVVGNLDQVEQRMKGLLNKAVDQGMNRFGVSTRSLANGQYEMVMIAVPSNAKLKAIPRHSKKSLHIEGTLDEKFADASVMITSPTGETAELKIKTSGKHFSADYSPPKKGIWQIEVLGQGKLGPEVLFLFPIYVGVPLPQSLEIKTAALESESVDQLEKIILNLVNTSRKSAGQSSLKRSNSLSKVARKYSEEMATTGLMAHISQISGTVDDRVAAADLRLRVTENLAMAVSAQSVHDGLMRSPGHRANILDSRAVAVGIGVVLKKTDSSTFLIVTQLFDIGPDGLDYSENKLISIINQHRKDKRLKPLSKHHWLMETANNYKSCSFNSPIDGKELGKLFKQVKTVAFETNNIIKVLEKSQDLYDKQDTDIGLAITPNEKNKTKTICVLILLGKR